MCWSGTTNGTIPNGSSGCISNPGPVGDTDYLYDGDGNLCWSAGSTGSTYNCTGTAPTGATTYTYNKKNQTTNIGGTTMTYADIGQSERTSTNGTTIYVNGLLGLTARNASGTWIDFTRDPGGGLNTLRQGNGTGSANDFYAADALGSTIALTASSGTTDDATYTYDPYGATTSTGTLAGTNPWQYAGGYSTQSLAVEKFGDRYYNAGLQRWTQPDSQGGGFAYAGDDPANLIDPTGRSTLCPAGDALPTWWPLRGPACFQPFHGIRLLEVALTMRGADVCEMIDRAAEAGGLGLAFVSREIGVPVAVAVTYCEFHS